MSRRKYVEIFIASYANAKNTESICVMYYRTRFRLFRDSIAYTTHEGAQLRALLKALESLKEPAGASVYLSSKKLYMTLEQRLGGYMVLGNIDKQSDAGLLKRYYDLSKLHTITLLPL